MNQRTFSYLLVCSAVLAPAHAYAAAPAPLSLSEAATLARTNNLSVRQSRQAIQVTEAEKAVTLANSLPSLSLSSSANYQELPGASRQAFSGGGFGNIVGFPANGAFVDTTLSANQVIFDAFATRDQVAIIDANTRAAHLAAVQSEQDVMLQSAIAYFDVLRTEGLARVAAEALKQAKELLRLSELRWRTGTGTKSDVLQQRAQLANATGQFTQAQNAVNLARLNLSNVLNAPVSDRPLVAHVTVPTISVQLARDLETAVARRTEVLQLEARQEAEETRVSLESRALLPTMQATSRYAQRNFNEGQFLAGVTVNWAVFDSFRARNRMASAAEQARSTGLQLEQSRQRVALEIRQQFQSRQEARQRVSSAREGLAAAQEAYRLALKRYEAGVATPFEVTNVQNTHIQSQNNYIQAINDLNTAEVRLARALGFDLANMLAKSTSSEKKLNPEPAKTGR
ncbi:MAG: TolC family protein [Candidatus Sericytochromatia bacterium]|nr:TolC family protein [Candidatus Sericytochromatia bacterium]